MSNPRVLFVILLLAYLNKESLAINNKSFIVNGKEARQKQFPYQVSLLKTTPDNSLYQWCGGSILTKHFVITAAHCVDKNLNPKHYKIVVGSLTYTEGGKEYDIEKLILHPEYSNNKNDIALLKVGTEIEFDSYVQPINISEGNVTPGSVAKISGWGVKSDDEDKVETSTSLLYINVQIISKDDCNKYYEGEIGESELCVRNEIGTGACFGDSGGPLAVHGELVGLTNYAHGIGCKKGFPDVYTKVAYYKDWIEKYITPKYELNAGNAP